MKRIVLFLFAIFTCVIAYAATETINWYMDGNTYATTTCQTGADITLPTTPYKKGYTFQGWDVKRTPVEYLEINVEGPIIDTGYIPSNKTRIKTKFLLADVSNGKAHVFGILADGNHNSSKSYEFFVYDRVYHFIYSGTFYTKSNATNGDNIILDWNKNVLNFSVNSTNRNDTLTPKTFTSSYTMPLFSLRSSTNFPSRGSFVGKMYYFQIYDNDTLVRDFIPVLDSNGIPCMYDKVEGKFYYNQGTGNFIAGPVIN